MSWEVMQNGSVSARPLPVRSLDIPLRAVWKGDGSVEIHGVEWWATFPDYQGLDFPLTVSPVGPEELSPVHATDAQISLRCVIDARFLQLLEERRNGGGPLKMQFRMNIRFRSVLTHQFASGPAMGNALEHAAPLLIRSFGPPRRDQVLFDIVLQRDEWLGLLRALQWDEFQVFEVAVRAMTALKGFQKALGHLKDAEIAFRQGQWSVTVMEARKACEAAAMEVETDGPANAGSPYRRLLAHVLPAEQDEPKRNCLDYLMLGLAQLRHPSAHGHFETQIERADAELAVTVAIALFRYIGELTARRA